MLITEKNMITEGSCYALGLFLNEYHTQWNVCLITVHSARLLEKVSQANGGWFIT